MTVYRKDGGWGWVVVMAAFFINVVMDGVRYSFGLLYIEFYNYFRASHGLVGWVGGIMFGLLLIAAPVSGAMVNKYNARVVTIAGSIFVFVGFLISVFATHVWHLCLTLGVISGLGFSMMFVSFYVILVQYFDKRRSLAIGITVSGSGLGGFVFNPLTSWLLETYAWRGTLLIISGILLNGVVCGAVMRPLPEVNKESSQLYHYSADNERSTCIPADDMPFENGNGERLSLSSGDIKLNTNDENDSTYHGGCDVIGNIFHFSLLRNKRFLVFISSLICINISYMVPYIYVPDMAIEQIDDVTFENVVWFANAMCIANVASRAPMGFLFDRHLVASEKLMAILCMVAGLSVGVAPFCRSYVLLMTLCVIYSISIVSAMVLIPIVLSELFGESLIADSFGLSLCFGGISGLIGPTVAGFLYDATGSYELSFCIGGAEFFLGGVFLLLLPHVKNEEFRMCTLQGK